MSEIMDTNGMLVSNDDGVFFIPKNKLDEYRLDEESAADAKARYGGDEVAGFASKPLAGGRGPSLDFGFSGPVRGPLIRASYADAAPTT